MAGDWPVYKKGFSLELLYDSLAMVHVLWLLLFFITADRTFFFTIANEGNAIKVIAASSVAFMGIVKDS